MGRIYLVRHAEAEVTGSQDPALSARGQCQARALATRLRAESVSALWHGPRRRTTETARVLAQHLDIAAEPCRAFDDLTAVPSADRRHEYPAHRLPWLDAVPAAERDENGLGLDAAWCEVQELARHQDGVVVTHAFVVSWFVTRALETPPATWMRLQPANAGLTVFRTDPHGGLVLEAYNETDHLAGINPARELRRADSSAAWE